MTSSMGRLSARAPGAGWVDHSRTLTHCVKVTRAARASHSAWVMRIAVITLWAVAVAKAQTSDSRIVFRDPTDSASDLLGRIVSTLTSRNVSDCPEYMCQTKDRQPRRNDHRHINTLGCFCDDACGTFGDCCRDAPKAAANPRSNLTCMPLKQYVGVYVVSRCPAGWPKDETRRRCEEEDLLLKDPQAGILVTNRRTGMTYRNSACAICHSDTKEAVLWQVRIECLTVSKRSQAKLQRGETGAWGVIRMENGKEMFHACSIDPFFPDTLTDVVRTCQPLVDSCPDSWTDKQVADLCNAYTAWAYDIEIRYDLENREKYTYRNPHCALCNGVIAEDILCEVGVGPRGARHYNFNVQAFSIMLDVGEKTGSNTVGANTVCDEGQRWDQFFVKCRTVFCDDGFTLKDDECVPVSNSRDLSLTEGGIIFPNGDGGKDDKDGRDIDVHAQETTDFQRCPKVYLSADEFVDNGDGTVFVEQYEHRYGSEEFEIREGELAICSVGSDFRKFGNALIILSLVFLSASIFCLCCHLVLFCLVPDLQNLSGKNLASLCVCFLLEYICLIAFLFEKSGTSGCRSLGIIMYAAFTASLFWRNVMAFDVFVTLRQATNELRVSSGQRSKRYLLYLLYVCCMTGTLVGASVATDSSGDDSNPYRPAFGERVCFFSRRRALLAFFAAPLIVVMVVNVAFFLGATRIIRSTTQSTAPMSYGPTRTNLCLYSRLAIMTGLSWLVGLIAGWLDFPPLWHAFIVLSTLQGVFIFVFFTLADRVRDWIRRDLSRCSRWQAEGKRDDVPGSDPGEPCTDSTALQLTDSRP